MRGKIVVAGLVAALAAGMAAAQGNASIPDAKSVNCAGTVTSAAVPQDTFIITGEDAANKLAFVEGDVVYVNKGSKQGVKTGDVFSVIRPVIDPVQVDWAKWQSKILRKMGTVWEDEGRVTVTEARENVSIGHLDHGCDFVQRGDILLPYMEHPTPPIKAAQHFDRFAPANGKPLAMVVAGRKFIEQSGTDDVVYVNLGAQQGVKVGDYFRIFRYTGSDNGAAYQTPRFELDVDEKLGPTYGFGGVSKKYDWSNVPRESYGEGLVLRTGPNSSSVLITYVEGQIYSGDYAELE